MVVKTLSPSRGDCFQAALKFVQQPGIWDYPEDYRVVHGNAATLRQDETINHAWVEEKDIVHEVSNGQHQIFSKSDYYKHFVITNVRRYTVDEAVSLCIRQGHWGPWD